MSVSVRILQYTGNVKSSHIYIYIEIDRETKAECMGLPVCYVIFMQRFNTINNLMEKYACLFLLYVPILYLDSQVGAV